MLNTVNSYALFHENYRPLFLEHKMVDHTTHNVLRVFLASPGDLPHERQASREVVDDVNNIIRELEWHIELLGWEDTLPSHTRPQEIINEDVCKCGLFIGLLWKRWGQHTGKYSSGFEEEFKLALTRHESTNSPEIWLCFKEVDRGLLEDPGNELK
ncbi:MAG: DUF4062 domain-containing protein [Candidatus Brocadiales bacterium]|nr:DUF4062 domain-containing protein [Candidatus Bathyanammoxibius sp.]